MTILTGLKGGTVMADLEEATRELVKGVRETGKGGKLSLTLKVSPAKKGFGQSITMDANVVATVPEVDTEPAFFFTTEDGGLQRNDPNQKELNLKVVVGGEGEKPTLKKVVNA